MATAGVAVPSADPHDVVAEVVRRAREAQRAFADVSQERADEAVALAWSLYKPEHAGALASLAVADTGLGNVADKLVKKQRKTFGTLRDLLRAKSVGIIEEDEAKGLVKYAKPIGVIGSAHPQTMLPPTRADRPTGRANRARCHRRRPPRASAPGRWLWACS